jgi:replicative DNA helicase
MSDGLKLLSLVVENGSAHIVRELDRELFIEDEGNVYDFVRRFYRRYGRVPAIATVEEETGVELPEAEETIDYYIQRVHDRRLYGVVRDSFNDLRDALRNYDMEAAKDVIDAMRSATRVLHSQNDIRTIDEALRDVWREYQYAHENPGISGVPSGWNSYDYRTGGNQAGDLVTWVARPSMGKTYLLLKQANHAWLTGFNVLVVTMEMTIEQITRRAVAMGAGVNPDYMRKGTLSTHAKRRIERFMDTMSGTERFRLFSGGLRKKTSDVDMLIQEYRPDICLIDGVYLMSPEKSRNMNKTEKVSEVFDELKQVTIAQNIPVVVTTQFNRTSGKKGKDGSLENIAFSDAISTHSSLVLSIQEGDAPYQRTRRKVVFLKGREGEQGRFDVNYLFRPIDFEEVAVEESAEAPASESVGVDWMA